ncbi:MAG: DUF3784 domain-containing protein [Bacillota bacterium]|jgi:hypothetical protein
MKYIFPVSMGFTVMLLAGLGIMVKYFKAYWLISGYNTMNKEQKKKVDIEGLANFIGNMCFVMSVIMLLGTAAIMYGLEVPGIIIFSAFFPITIYLIIKAQKFDGNTKNPDGTLNQKSKILIFGIIAFLTITAIGVGVLLYYSNQPAQFGLENGMLRIKGIYGEKIPLAEIGELYLKDTLPQIRSRNNGSSIGSMKKGHFKLESLGNTKLFVDTSKPPFIYIRRNGKLVILNCGESSETEKLYQELLKLKGLE